MKRFSTFTLALVSALLSLSSAQATSIPNADHPVTSLAPSLKLGYTSTITNSSAYSLAGEVGVNNTRVGATYGWLLTNNQRMKISGEYLWQRITYAFFSGNAEKWLDQGALGLAYQYDLAYNYHPQFDIDAYVSHARNKRLSTVTGTYIDSLGNPEVFTDVRRIAGSTAVGLAPGITFAPWQGGIVGVAANYDNVQFDIKNTPNKDLNGFGGTIKLDQAILEDVDLGLAAAFRQPFNNYAANLNWSHIRYGGDWTFGLFGEYTHGKDTLPDSWNAGLSANYYIDQRQPVMVPVNLKDERNLKAEIAPLAITDNLVAWTADPAVYMPQVLALLDSETTSSCPDGASPAFTGNIANPQNTDSGTFNVSAQFSGNNLTYSLSITPSLVDTDSVTIDASGQFTYAITASTYNVIITATNRCGSASSNSFFLNTDF